MRKSPSSFSSSASPEPKRHKTERDRITYLKNTIDEKNNYLRQCSSEIRDIYRALKNLLDAEPSDKVKQENSILNNMLASAEKSEKSLAEEIAEHKAELMQLEGAEPIPLPSPGMIYGLLLILFSLFLLFLFLNHCYCLSCCYCLIEHIAVIIM